MSNTPNALAEQFPEAVDKITTLKESDGHFARLCQDYDALNHKIHLAESNVTPTDDFHLIELRKQRLALLDEIATYLR